MPGYIPWKNVDLRLQSERMLWVSTVLPNGRPHAMPCRYWWDGRNVFFVADKKSQKAKNLAYQSSAVLHLDDGEHVVMMTGQAEIVTDRDQRNAINAVYGEKYMDAFTGTLASVLNPDDLLFRVRIESATAWMNGNRQTASRSSSID